MRNTSDSLILRTIDAHAAGEPLRLVVEGWPAPKGRTMLEKRTWARAKQDRLRRTLMFEPRGHADMYGAILTEPERADSDAGVLFMHNDGFSTMCGHGVIAVVTIAIERGLLHRTVTSHASDTPHTLDGPETPDTPDRSSDHDSSNLGDGYNRVVVLDAPAGQIRAQARVSTSRHGPKVDRVRFINVPSFVLAAALPVRLGPRTLRVDVAFGGAFYAIVDAESAGIPLVVERLSEFRQAGMTIKRAVESAIAVAHPDEPGLTGIYGTIFTAPPTSDAADLRNVTIFADHEVDRSPCGTGTCAVLAVLDAMGLVDPTLGRPFVHESLIGTTFSARVIDRTTVGECAAIIPELAGEAWITGDHRFVVNRDDPLGAGFRI